MGFHTWVCFSVAYIVIHKMSKNYNNSGMRWNVSLIMYIATNLTSSVAYQQTRSNSMASPISRPPSRESLDKDESVKTETLPAMDEARGANFVPRLEGLMKGARNNVTKAKKQLKDLAKHGHDGDISRRKLEELRQIHQEIDTHTWTLRNALIRFEESCYE